MWGEVGNETGAGLRAPVYKLKELVFYPGGVRKPWEVFEQDSHYTGSCVRKSPKGPSLESRAQSPLPVLTGGVASLVQGDADMWARLCSRGNLPSLETVLPPKLPGGYICLVWMFYLCEELAMPFEEVCAVRRQQRWGTQATLLTPLLGAIIANSSCHSCHPASRSFSTKQSRQAYEQLKLACEGMPTCQFCCKGTVFFVKT